MKKILIFIVCIFYFGSTNANYTQIYNNPSTSDIGQTGVLFYHPDYISSSEAVAQKYCIDRGGLGFTLYNGNNNIIYDVFLLVSNGNWLNVVGFGGTFNSITCEFYSQVVNNNGMNGIINTMASGATSQTTSILSGPAGGYIYFGLAVLLIGIGYLILNRKILKG